MFPWGNTRRDSKTKFEDDREKQIRSLKSAFPSIRRPNNDDSLFEMKFVVDGIYSSLRIHIPADFPLIRPVLEVAGPLTHPWLDQFKQVAGFDKLLHWSKNSSLVEIVEETLATLMSGRNVTQPASNNTQLNTNSSNWNQGSSQQSSPYLSVNNTLNGGGIPAGSSLYPPIPASFPPQIATSAYPALPIPDQKPSSLPYLQSAQQSPFPYQTQSTLQPQYQLQQQGQGQQQPYYPQQSHNVGTGQISYSQSSNVLYPTSSPHHSQNSPDITAIASAHMSNENLTLLNPGFIEKKSETDSLEFFASTRSPITMPDPPTSFPELDRLTTLQLERLNNDSAALDAHVRAESSVESMISLRDQMRKSNYEKASKTLALDVEMNKLHREAEDLKAQLQRLAKAHYEKLLNVAQRHEVKKEAVLAAMNSKKATLDEASEEIAFKFVDGEVDLNSFKQEYLDIRTKYHVVCGKLDCTIR